MKCTLVNDAGASVDVDQTTQGVLAIRDILERQVIHQRLLPRSVKELAAGRTVTMGAFQLSKTGLAYKDRQLSWKHVERCRADGGFIFVKKRGESEPWAEVIYRDVPNGSLLVLLCEHMRTEAGALA